MYATCLFCNGDLGRNEVVEHFPVGRRLAYDAAKGRLWVVCRRCERWNLTPLEERWEAIEEAERSFRATRQRIATDQIALARLREGLELVRIGAPPRLELATWRYGDQFGRRRRKYLAWTTLGAAASLAPFVGMAWSAAVMAGSIVQATHSVLQIRKARRDARVPRVRVPDGEGGKLALTAEDIQRMQLARIPESGDWCLTIQQAKLPLPLYGYDFATANKVTLRGADAQRALTVMLPHVNSLGGTRRQVAEAVQVLAGAPSLHRLIYDAGASKYGIVRPMALALEMALHEDDERRAMEGELAELEERWREAEEIASIADALVVPRDVEARLDALRGYGTRPVSDPRPTPDAAATPPDTPRSWP